MLARIIDCRYVGLPAALRAAKDDFCPKRRGEKRYRPNDRFAHTSRLKAERDLRRRLFESETLWPVLAETGTAALQHATATGRRSFMEIVGARKRPIAAVRRTIAERRNLTQSGPRCGGQCALQQTAYSITLSAMTSNEKLCSSRFNYLLSHALPEGVLFFG